MWSWPPWTGTACPRSLKSSASSWRGSSRAGRRKPGGKAPWDKVTFVGWLCSMCTRTTSTTSIHYIQFQLKGLTLILRGSQVHIWLRGAHCAPPLVNAVLWAQMSWNFVCDLTWVVSERFHYQKGTIICQAPFRNFEVQIYFSFFSHRIDFREPKDPSHWIPGEKIVHFDVKTIVLGQKL